MTLFEMKEKQATLQAELASVKEYLLDKSADPNVPMEELDAKKAKAEEIQKRLDNMNTGIKEAEDAQRKAVAMKAGSGAGMTEQDVRNKAKADFYRDALTGNTRKAYEGLGAIPAADEDLGNGDKLLPTNLSNTLLVEPVEDNSLRTICQMTNITGYEEPKLGFTIEDTDIADITDKDTAKEIALAGDTVHYGRHKVKVKATVKDTVLHGTNVDLVSNIENALRSALAIREKTYAFMQETDSGVHDHMSFYLNQIKEVEGADIISAIIAAWADLPDAYSANASVVMRKQDYYAAVRDLANQAVDLWGKKPEDVLGIPVVFNDKAVKPVVGNFRYYGINYDIGTIYDTDKDVDKGEYKFVLTAWGDQQIRLKSAFRIAKVTEDP